MAAYRVEIKRSAERDLGTLEPNLGKRILLGIEALSAHPHPVQSRKLVGSENSYRLRVGRYRVLYQIDHQCRLITVFAIGHRREIYR